MPAHPLRIHILGLGAVGGLFATRLARFNNLCAILKTPPESPASSGRFLRLGVASVTGDAAASLPSPVDIEWQLSNAEEPVEFLLVTTKSYHVKAALAGIKTRLNASTVIVLLQNGLGSQFEAAGQFPQALLFAATTTEGANIQPCRHGQPADMLKIITHAGAGITKLGGITPHACKQGCEPLRAALNQAGFKTEFLADIWQALWQKFTVNCGINPYTAILNCANGKITDYALFKRTITALCEELSAIVSAAGYPEPASSIEQRIHQVAAATAQNISSMLQDIRAGRPTEIDAINGFAADYAHRKGLPESVNDELTQRIKALEKSVAKPPE